MSFCPYCTKEFISKKSMAGHCSQCTKNPKYSILLQNRIRGNIKKTEKYRELHKPVQKKVECHMCKVEFTTIEPMNLRKERYYCSTKCGKDFCRKTVNYTKVQETLRKTLAAKRGLTLEEYMTRSKMKYKKNKCKKEGCTSLTFSTSGFCKIHYTRKISEETRKVLSIKARQRGFGGKNFNKKAVGWYNSSIAGRVWLDSTYELKVAQELDKNNIEWKRAKSFKYIHQGVERRYIPDFYLLEFDVFLDPKNSYLIEKDKYKLDLATEQNSDLKLLILTDLQLTWDKIISLIQTSSFYNYARIA